MKKRTVLSVAGAALLGLGVLVAMGQSGGLTNVYLKAITTATEATATALGGGAVGSTTEGIPLDTGTVTSGSTTVLTDTAKKWTVNGLAGCPVRVLTGTGAGDLRAIVSNTATALTVATWTAPAAGDTYAIYHPIIPIVVGSGTAGSAAGGVFTVQGVASMTPVIIVGSGTAGTAAGGVLTVQGVASMTPILATVTGAVTTSGTVTEASGATIATNTSTLAGAATTFQVPVKIDQAAAGITTILALEADKVIYLHALVGTMDVAGTVTISYDDDGAGTNAVTLTGNMAVAATGGMVIPFTADTHGCLRTATAKELTITTTGGSFDGYAIVSKAAP